MTDYLLIRKCVCVSPPSGPARLLVFLRHAKTARKKTWGDEKRGASERAFALVFPLPSALFLTSKQLTPAGKAWK